MEIIIEEIVQNIDLNIEETVLETTIQISEMSVPGKSAYESALDGGFIGTELEFNENLSNQINFSQVDSYSIMLSLPVSSKLVIVKVLNDENKGIENTIYHIYPDGIRMWIAANKDN